MRHRAPDHVQSRIGVAPILVLTAATAVGACFGRGPAAVTPEEIPQLEQRLEREPNNGQLLLRYSAALFAAGNCDSARVVAVRGMANRPQDALGPLVVGQCYEQADDWDQAVAVYQQFLAIHEEGPGVPAVRARENLALRGRAVARARQALANEAELTSQAGDPQTLAVLPLDIVGDSTYRPLGRGLAQMLTSDLALLQRFRLVERLQVGALMNEMQLAQQGAVDPATAAQVGRLLRAGRMVQGLAAIPGEDDVRLEATVVLSDGQVANPETQSGRLRDLLRMEKQVVIGIADQLGYVLSEAERRSILENGTQNLAAFLAYSRGLEAEDLGDYNTAAQYFSQAVQQDPGFTQARQSYQANSVAQQVQAAAPAQVTTVAQETAPAEPAAQEAATDFALNATVSDVGGTAGESQTETGTGESSGTPSQNKTSIDNPTPQMVQEATNTTVTGIIKIFFRIP